MKDNLNENCITYAIDTDYVERIFKINTDKINSLEDVKEILGALDLGIKGTSKIMSTNGHDMDKLSKYLK
ncbi:MAG: hypothetical protein ACLTG7_04180 [Romboutsia sp.]